MKVKRGLGTALLALSLAACTDGTWVHRYLPLSEMGWERCDTLQFQLPTVPTTGDYSLCLGLRYDTQFPYEGIWIEAETRLKNPASIRRDTLYFPMMDEEGHSQGQGINLQQKEMPFTTLHLQKGQQATIRLRHIMARETIPHIKDAGVNISMPN